MASKLGVGIAVAVTCGMITNLDAATHIDSVSASGTFSLGATLAAPDIGGLFDNAIAVWHDDTTDAYRAAVGAPADDGVTGAVYLYEKAATDHEWHAQARIVASDAIAGDEFGFSVAIDGDNLVVGAPFHASDFFVGAAYVFTRDAATGQWTQRGDALVCGADNFGWTVALSGDNIAVAEPRAERVYTFADDGTAWTALDTVSPASSTGFTDFGYALALSGDRLVVGAPFDSSVAPLQGSAQVFVRSRDTHSPPGWSAEQILRPAKDDVSGPIFGFSVALSGDTIAVGAPWENGSAGSAHLFARDPLSGVWSKSADVAAKAGAAGDLFGSSVTLTANALAVGSSGYRGNTGNVYTYTGSGADWSETASLAAADNVVGDEVGAALAMSGGEVLTNAWQHGFVESFGQTGSRWSSQPPLTAAGDDGDAFGTVVAISGDTAIISAPALPNGVGGVGAAMVLVQDAASGAWNWQATLPDAEAGDDSASFHRCAPVAIDGDTLAIGAPSENFAQGVVHIYTRAHGAWTKSAQLTASSPSDGDQFGCALAIDGDVLTVGAPNVAGSGAAFVFTRSGAMWSQQAVLEPADLTVDDRFGDSIAIANGRLVVGAPFQNEGTGAVYVFAKSGGAWTPQAKLVAPDAAMGDLFGATLALSPHAVLVGAPSTSVAGNDGQGRAYLFQKSASAWTSTTIDSPTAGALQNFGSAIGFGDDVMAIGARGADRAFVFAQVSGAWSLASTLVGDGDTRFGNAVAIGAGGVLVGAPQAGRGVTPGGRAYFFADK